MNYGGCATFDTTRVILSVYNEFLGITHTKRQSSFEFKFNTFASKICNILYFSIHVENIII